jgi:hypothetical protein
MSRHVPMTASSHFNVKPAWRSVRASEHERTRRLPGDERIPNAIDTLTHGVTIRCAPRDVWPWLVQMGAGSRAGWYSYDWLDNRRQPSATRIVPELQHPAIGAVFPALPGVTEGFFLLALEPQRVLMLGWRAPDGALEVTWTFVLEEHAPGVTACSFESERDAVTGSGDCRSCSLDSSRGPSTSSCNGSSCSVSPHAPSSRGRLNGREWPMAF